MIKYQDKQNDRQGFDHELCHRKIGSAKKNKDQRDAIANHSKGSNGGETRLKKDGSESGQQNQSGVAPFVESRIEVRCKDRCLDPDEQFASGQPQSRNHDYQQVVTQITALE